MCAMFTYIMIYHYGCDHNNCVSGYMYTNTRFYLLVYSLQIKLYEEPVDMV